MQNKKYYSLLAVIIALIMIMTTLAMAAGETYSWYCKRVKDHKCPKIEPQMNFIGKYNGVYIGNNPTEKVVYLTFDAGYENGNVEKILDVLKKHNAKGAFFILANLIKRDTGLVKRMAEDGHLICNHTYRHKDITKLDENGITDEIASVEKLLYDTAGVRMSKYFRPPEGKFSEESLAIVNKLGYKTVFWSLAYADWDNEKQPNPEKALTLLFDNIHNGAVILLHPTSKTNALILDRFLTGLEDEGYRFGTLDELYAGIK